jgi:hypothetical protein
MKIGKGNRSTRRKPAPAPLCPPQIPLDQTRDRTRAAAVGSQRLTAWAIVSVSCRLDVCQVFGCIVYTIWQFDLSVDALAAVRYDPSFVLRAVTDPWLYSIVWFYSYRFTLAGFEFYYYFSCLVSAGIVQSVFVVIIIIIYFKCKWGFTRWHRYYNKTEHTNITLHTK